MVENILLLSKEQIEAARIMQEHKPATMGEIFKIAHVTDDPFSDPLGDKVGHGWNIVDAHYASLNDSAYRELAGMGQALKGGK